jgi:hypothetical protein
MDSDNEDDAPTVPPKPTPPPAVTSAPPTPQEPPHTAIIQRSGWIPVPTVKGASYKNLIIAEKARLKCQQDLCAA